MFKRCLFTTATLSIAGLLVSLMPDAHAAGLVRKGEVKQQDTFNPKTDAADLELPMPCDMKMVFRVVAVPVSSYVTDLETYFGSDDADRPGQEFYDRQYTQGISGPFRLTDMPKPWQDALGKAGESKTIEQKAFYLIGKYEVSTRQWDAVMNASCPTALGADAALPKATISWFDSVEFSRRYMEWLLENAPKSLPRFANDDKNVGYLRLPTEREWEYAARGGHKVSTEMLRNESFFERDKNLPYTDYAVFLAEGAAQPDAQPQNIGSRLPNPLGVYDTAGNVAEMVLDPFQFSSGGRLVGAAGGFVRKGGSFMTGLSEIMPGRREENAFYVNSGPNKARDMGFRLVLSAINIPNASRLDTVKEEWKKAGVASPFSADVTPNLLDQVDKLNLQAENEKEKKMLAELQAVIKDNNIAMTRQQTQIVQLHVRSSLYIIENIRNMFIRRKEILNRIDAVKEEMKKYPNADKKEGLSRIETYNGYVASFDAAINAAVGHYKLLLDESGRYATGLYDEQLAFVNNELVLLAKNKVNAFYADALQKSFERLQRHVALKRAGKTKELTVEALRKDMVSAEFQ